MGLLLELVDLLKLLQDQLDKKSKFDQNLFTNLIIPIWERFNAIHDDYLSTFGNYIETVKSKNFKIDLLIEKIHQDSIRSSNLRSDLFNQIDVIRSSTAKHLLERLLLDSFLSSISSYFSFQEYIPFSINQVSEKDWIMLSDQSLEDWDWPAQEEVWKLSKHQDKENKKAVNEIYRKMPSNGKTNIKIKRDYQDSYSEGFYPENDKDILISIGSDVDISKPKTKEKLLLEWGKKISDLTTHPGANLPRAVILSALLLNQETDQKDITEFLTHILLLLQDRYHIVSKRYYKLKISQIV